MRRRGGTPCWIPFSLAVPGFALRNRFRVVRDLCFTVVEGPLCAQSPIYFLIQRQRSPAAHLVRRKGGTHCSDFHFGCSDVPFPVPNRLFLRRIRPHLRPGGSSYFLSERQGSGDPAPSDGYPGPPCSTDLLIFSSRSVGLIDMTFPDQDIRSCGPKSTKATGSSFSYWINQHG